MTSEDKPTSPGLTWEPPSKRPTRPLGLLAATLVCVLIVGGIALYGMAGRGGKASPHIGACAQSLDKAAAVEPLIHGEVAALMPVREARPLDTIPFDDTDGHKTTIGVFKGQTILLNLWATWCVPCRAEMPALDKLQANLGSKRFSVVPVNIDTARLDKPRAFLKEIGATRLPYFSDRSADILQALKGLDHVEGLPTSILIGKDSCAIGVMAGPAQWDSPDAKALIEKASS